MGTNIETSPAAAANAAPWLRITTQGLWCEPGGFFIDPPAPVDRALITHGHSDHARPGHARVLTTPATAAIISVRYGDASCGRIDTIEYGESCRIGDAVVTFHPAGHILGSAQVMIEHAGARVLITGDFKRRPDPTCAAFAAVAADVLITEATFGLPVFRHPADAEVIGRLLASLATFPERPHVIGVYALGKCQRLIALLRAAGYQRPVWLHGALLPLCRLYEDLGVHLGPLRAVASADRTALAGELILCPPSALADRWIRGFRDPVTGMASGWMLIRQRARQRGVELPLPLSDHADWPELTATLRDVGAAEVLVTHGREEALVHYARGAGFAARALAIAGYDEEGS
jgi:putative mRNA 3-end processing factor